MFKKVKEIVFVKLWYFIISIIFLFSAVDFYIKRYFYELILFVTNTCVYGGKVLETHTVQRLDAQKLSLTMMIDK